VTDHAPLEAPVLHQRPDDADGQEGDDHARDPPARVANRDRLDFVGRDRRGGPARCYVS
jgi:hypothetical protein